eukprot:g6187.t1
MLLNIAPQCVYRDEINLTEFMHSSVGMAFMLQRFLLRSRGVSHIRSFASAKETLFDNIPTEKSQYVGNERNSTHTTKSSSHNENIIWSEALFTSQERMELLGNSHSGCTIWITGLSGSGKSTIAAQVEKELLEMGVMAYRLDGDNVRFGLCSDLGFSAADRSENIRRVAETSALFADAGLISICAFISPYAEDRDRARRIHEDRKLPFIEVHAHVNLEIAEQRDPKGLYKKARAGELKNFTGIDDRFDEPLKPEVKLHTHDMSVPACTGAIISEIKAFVQKNVEEDGTVTTHKIIPGKFRLK